LNSRRPPPFTRADLARAQRTLMRDGRWANARVERVAIDGGEWTVKDFSSRPFLARNVLGRFLVRRELAALNRLAGLPGVPADAFRLDAHAIAARYLPGTTLAKLPPGRVSTAFLEALERLVRRVHERGIVHLDTRGNGNMLMMADGEPGIFDFQAALSTRWMPRGLKRLLESFDLSGVYKKWAQWQPESLGESRRALFERTTRWRRYWIFRGYLGVRK
jgi:hypothetical protein